MENRTRNRAFGMLLSAKRHTRYIGILACLALVVAFGVTMGLRRNGRAATVTQTVLDCHAASGVAHSHNADCYDADGNLVCPLQERELHAHSDACYDEEGNLTCGKQEVTEEHAHGAGCFKTVTVTVDDPEPETEAQTEDVAVDESSDSVQDDTETPMPAKTFEEKVDLAGKKNDSSDDLIVRVEAPEGALPEGTKMTVKPITAKRYIDSAKSEVEDKLQADVEAVQAVDIAFIHDGKEVEPEKNVHVSMRYADVQYTQDKAIEIVHVDDKYNADIVGKKNEQTEKDEVTFESDRFSVYAMVITTQHIDSNGNVYDVTVSYGPEAKIPDGSWLRVNEIASDDAEYDRARNAVLADKLARGEDVDLSTFGFAALDISIIDPSGNEIEPSATVKVDLKVKSLPEVEDLAEVAPTMEVQHHVATGNKVIVETVAGGEASASFSQATDASVIATKSDSAVDPSSLDEGDFKTASLEEINEALNVKTSFKTDAFSTYTISWGTRSYRIHYVDTAGNSLTPTRTPEFSNGYKFLIYDIEGYEYDSTHYGSRTGTAIKPLLANYGNDRVYLDNNNNWQYLRNDVYVVYKAKKSPSSGGTPQVDVDETWPDEENPARKPQFTKSSTNNGNGTNNISLTITGPEKPVEKGTPADVIVVFDVSGSMDENLSGNTKRLAAAKTAVNTMANTLLNGQNGNVRMALISFSTTATEVQGFTNDYSTFRGKVNGLTAAGGTNWEQALQLANQMQVRSDAATYVVFVTDGDPTFRVSRGNVSDGNLDMYDDNTYEYYRNNNVFGEGNDDSDGRNLSFAVDQVKAIDGANKNFYAIGISNSVTKVQNLTTQGGVAADHAFIASNSTAMENAFKSITESIKSELGFGNLEITDGITALTNAEMKVMQTVDPNSFKYYRIVNGVKTEWTTREADGCAAASYNESKGAVEWNMGETFQLEDGVTYVVEFTVWPSQAAYDLIADLNNGLKTYATLTDAEKAQVVEVTAPTETTTGTYALRTNTDEVEATYNRTTKTGDTVAVSDTTDVTAEYKEGTIQNMNLDSDYITVKKEWHNALDWREEDGVTLTVTKDGDAYLDDVALNNDNDWTSDEQYISTGFITTASNGRYNVRETGHDYTVTEPVEFSYYWDLTADTYRPMVVDGELKMLVKTDNPTGTEGTHYYVIGGNKYQVSNATTPQLTAKNNRRSNLNLKKLVTANTQAVDNIPNPDDVFTYTITITDFNGDAVWFGAQDKDGNTVLIDNYSQNVTAQLDDSGNPTGSYSVASGTEFTIGIKADWNVRFFNLPTGTTYSIQETGMADGYAFVKAETSAECGDPDYADIYQGTAGAVAGTTVTGTIDQPNNVYSTEYTNNWDPNNQIVIIKTDENDAKLAGATFKLSKFADDEWKQIATFTSNATAGETLKVGHGLYKLEESSAPSNYSKTDTVYFKVETDGNTTTVTLTDAEGAEKAYADATASGNTVTIKDWPLTTAEATKAWRNADGTTTAPAGATVVYTLYIDGEKSNYTVTLDGADDTAPTGTAIAGYESEGWKAEFANLPKYKVVEGEAVEIKYTIAETTTYPGYTASTTDPVASGETITNTQEATTANALKAWKNADDTTTAPDGATVVYTLYADGAATSYTVTLDGNVDTKPTGTAGYESAAWKAEFVNLPKYKVVEGKAVEIVYTIAETTTYPGYTASTTDPVASGETITNTQGSTETFALKAWKNADGTTEAPEGGKVTFTLYADGAATSYSVTLDGEADVEWPFAHGYESEPWKASFVKLPKSKVVDGEAVDIVYTIAETKTYPGYTPSTTDPVGSGSTITNTQEPTTADATKAWKNADGSTTAPQGGTVTYTLYADGEETSYTVELDGTVDTEPEVTGGYESEAWKATFVKLPKYKPGTTTEIVYTIAETGTYPGYTASTSEPVASGATITNTQEPTTADATKAWKNANGSTTAPEGGKVTFTLYADGTATEYTVELDGTVDTAPTGTAGYESEAWKATFVNLPKYKVVEGEAVEIKYTISETKTFPGYTVNPNEPVESGATITNEQEAVKPYAVKAWKNADGSPTAPEGGKVTFTLFADQMETEYTVELDGVADGAEPDGTAGYESSAWTATFVNLPKYKADGITEIKYTIAETGTYDGYTAKPAGPVNSGETIINEQVKTVIQIIKIGDYDESKTLGGVQFKLFSDAACTNQMTEDSTGATIGEAGVITTGNDGTAAVGTLIPGTYYLQEIKTADGYNLLSEAIEFSVKDDGTIEYTTGDKYFDGNPGAYRELEGGGYGIYINNPSGNELPLTGGPGTALFNILGSAIATAAILTYLLLSRRTSEGRSWV